MVIHDNSDLLLPTAKICKWMNWSIPANIFFGLFVSSWIISRIIIFTWKLVIPIFTYGYSAFQCHFSKYVMFTILILILLSLHCYWVTFIIKAVAKICRGGEAGDARSDDEQDEEEIIISPEEFSSDEESIPNKSEINKENINTTNNNDKTE